MATAKATAKGETMSGLHLENQTDAKIQRLVEKHIGQIEAAARRVLGPHYAQALDDLCQAVRIAIWQVLEKGQHIEQWEGFIYHCAHKRALDLLKQIRRRAQREVSLDELRGEGEQAVEERLAAVAANVDRLDQALMILEEELAKLPTPMRLTVLLRKGEGYSRAEVARMLHCSEATVDYRLRQGLHRLRKRLKRCGLQSSKG